jgi:hypothetical protein
MTHDGPYEAWYEGGGLDSSRGSVRTRSDLSKTFEDHDVS